MEVLSIEGERKELINKLTYTVSPRIKLLYLFRFYEKLQQSKSPGIIESYLPEQIENYITFLYKFEPAGLSPQLVENILKQIEQISQQSCIKQFYDRLNSAAENLRIEYDPVKNALEGIDKETTGKGNLYFPVLEVGEVSGNETTGLLETLTVQIKEGKGETKFLVTPAGREIEKAIAKQIETSWNYAIGYVKKYLKKTADVHKVFIQFDHRYGEYVGNSLGTALALTFIKELLQFYNLPILLNFNGNVAVTGGLSEGGNILCVGEDVIKQKTEMVFFSGTDLFVIMEKEKPAALKKLEELKEEFPKRELKIIGVEDFEDLMNRRNIIRLKRQKIIVRSGKYLKKHWVNTLVYLLLASAIAFLFVLDFDSNPAILKKSGRFVLIQNKNGKGLWKKPIADKNLLDNNAYFGSMYEIVVDIDDDGLNEVLIVEQDESSETFGGLGCYNYKGSLIWFYEFKDSISTNYESFTPNFPIHIAGIDTLNNRKIVYLFAQHQEYFPTAIFRLDLKTGKRLPGTYWNPGGVAGGVLADLNNDGTKELVAAGYNNEFNTVVLFAMNKDSLYGRGPAINRYVYPGRKLYKFIHYMMIPNSDYNNFMKMRYAETGPGSLSYIPKDKITRVNLFQGPLPDIFTACYRIDLNFKVKDIVINDRFRVARDSFVARGLLSPPYTDTKEYVQILKDQVRYWNGEKFVTAEEYFEHN